MRNLYINQFDDVFYVRDKIIIINYLNLRLRTYKNTGNIKIISRQYKSLYKKANELYSHLKIYTNDFIPSIVLIPSLLCNMKCEYCYEGKKINTHSNVKNYDDIFFSIREICEKDCCNLTLLGGEPICKENIEILKEEIKSLKKFFTPLSITCVSNGLEVKRLYEEYKNLGINSFQITIDGNESIHNQRRPAINPRINSFQEVFSSIIFLVKKGFEVEIRINIDNDNIACVKDIINLIFNHKLYKYLGSNLKIYAYPISENGVCTDLCYLPEPTMLKSFFNQICELPLHKRIISARFHGLYSFYDLLHNKMPKPTISFCSANNHQFVISPEGNIHTCWWGYDIDNFKVGYFSGSNYIIDKERINEWNSRDILSIPKCRTCKYMFFCGGGCTYKSYKKNGYINSPNCADFYSIFQEVLEYTYAK